MTFDSSEGGKERQRGGGGECGGMSHVSSEMAAAAAKAAIGEKSLSFCPSTEGTARSSLGRPLPSSHPRSERTFTRACSYARR